MKIKEIMEKISEEKRGEVEETVNACMKSICCENVNWKEFSVYESSSNIMQEILENLAIEFLLPIAEVAREEPEREIVVFCNIVSKKEDDIWFVRVKSKQLHATINLSNQTVSFLNLKKK